MAGEIQGQDILHHTVERINTKLPAAVKVILPDGDEDCPRQHTVLRHLYKQEFEAMKASVQPASRARLIAYSSPGAGRWQHAIPSKTIDRYLSDGEVAITLSLQLGVDVYDRVCSCRFCGAVLDTKGVHSILCTGGGDTVLRHNDVRDIVYSFCRRGQLRPVLEKAGILQEPGVLIDLRRPADVLVSGLRSHGGQDRAEISQRTALDIKIINALGQGHYEETLQGPNVAAAAYREQQNSHQQTGTRCAARGIQYEPMVFTAQGGCEARAESIMNQIVQAVGDAEGISKAVIKADFMEQISFSIARSVARAVARRTPPQMQPAARSIRRIVAESGGALEW